MDLIALGMPQMILRTAASLCDTHCCRPLFVESDKKTKMGEVLPSAVNSSDVPNARHVSQMLRCIKRVGVLGGRYKRVLQTPNIRARGVRTLDNRYNPDLDGD